MRLIDVIKFEQSIIQLSVLRTDFYGKPAGRPFTVGYRFEQRKLLEALTGILKTGGTKVVGKLRFTAKEGAIHVTSSAGLASLPGDPKEQVIEFLKKIGKEPAPKAEKPPAPKPEPKKPSAKRSFYKKKAVTED